ncbi:MAG: hypothetical protein NPIRA02_05830 [Nitrospirales bacterium]|nr:MAG: hypothetical protein NPIRA02_05830 [Nitrospirales bacterium]
MPEQHLLPVALPRGRGLNEEGQNIGKITIYFSPRLKDEDVLLNYPEWLNWPEMLDRMNVRLRLMDSGNSEWVSLTRVSDEPDPNKWENLFAASTPVEPHRFVDWSAAPLQTVASSDFDEAILDMYTRIAVAHPSQPPSDVDVFSIPQARQLTRAVEQAIDYLQPMHSEETERKGEVADPEWDFHAYVSLLGGHPELLRHLGIAVDYEFVFPDTVKVPTAVAVQTTYPDRVMNGPGREIRLMTKTTDAFFAEPNPVADFHEQSEGFLELRNQKAYLSILDSYSTATRLTDLDGQQGQIEESVPALITRALTLVRPDLVKTFENRTARQAQIEKEIGTQLDPNTPPKDRQPVVLYAEDVTIGHRIDVLRKESSGFQWRSLFDRKTDANGYQFTRVIDGSLNVHPDPDEGWAQTLLVTELEEDLSSQINKDDKEVPLIPYALRRLDDQLYRWDGWSGAVRRPGCVLNGVKGSATDVEPQLPVNDTDVVQFAANYEVVPCTLPQLRFGDAYIMRARCVDLAGNSVGLDAVSPEKTETDPKTFGRLEPIAAPFIVRRSERPIPGVGDDALTVVLLGDYDIDDKTVKGQERLLFPPRVGQDLCELHGEPAGGVEPASYDELKRRDAREPEDHWNVDPVTSEPIAQGDEHQVIEYLSDPLVGNLHCYRWGPKGGEYVADMTGAWPSTESARIEVIAGDPDTLVNPDSTTEFRFTISKADIVAVDFSYAPRHGSADEFGLWHRASPEEQDDLRPIIERGGHWMFSARRPVKMVYAVRRPLLAPDFEDDDGTPVPNRSVDDTGVEFGATFIIDRRSTSSVTLRASWTDLIDDVRLDAPATVSGGARLGRFETLRKADSECLTYTIANHRAELGDTRRHYARLHLEAFSYFSSYFTEERVVRMVGDAVMIDERGLADGTVTVRHGKENLEAELGKDFEVLGSKGMIKTIRGGAIKHGDQLTVRYIPLPISRTNEKLPAVYVIFPNTATPPPPQIDSVIPAAARDVQEHSISHDGRLLRVYLQRPWHVSGDGESLAVLIERNPIGVSNASRLGRDPAVTNANILQTLAPSAFPRVHSVVENYDGSHDLALHKVEYDAVSKRWFADIAVATELYRPFVQLVVARYQPDSITGKHLSPSVTLEPFRLGVSRQVELQQNNDGFNITVTGREHAGIPVLEKPQGQNEVAVTVQEADPDLADQDLRWITAINTATLARVAGPDGSSWSGQLSINNSTRPQRLLIEESEPALFGGEKPSLTSHVVYSEVMVLPKS